MVDISNIPRDGGRFPALDSMGPTAPDMATGIHALKLTAAALAKLAQGLHLFGVIDRSAVDKIAEAGNALEDVDYLASGHKARVEQAQRAALDALRDSGSLDPADFDAAVRAAGDPSVALAERFAEALAEAKVGAIREVLRVAQPRIHTGLSKRLAEVVANARELFRVLDGRLEPVDALTDGLGDTWNELNALRAEYDRVHTLVWDCRNQKLLPGPGRRDEVRWLWDFEHEPDLKSTVNTVAARSVKDEPERPNPAGPLRTFKKKLDAGPIIKTLVTPEEIEAAKLATYEREVAESNRKFGIDPERIA
ncbi:hypothetical protein AXK57_21730 [Tsukamurella pulmonis]|uniref:hypothetical protein n=1 Tax=Tsukamurella pulmonis TaxID=47312 RepID=UPI00079362B0|nr:hypothetical protein [Tsukamurella pulmonis]KXP11655.1 hypothetical protein AXK57_21730 [Tsukamurella pulmonis]